MGYISGEDVSLLIGWDSPVDIHLGDLKDRHLSVVAYGACRDVAGDLGALRLE